MIPGFEDIVEERIKTAQNQGRFDNLEGKGKPLLFEDSPVPEEFRMAHKILKNAGFLPPEVEIRKQITHVQELMDQTGQTTADQAKLHKKLNYLMAKLDAVRSTGPGNTLARDQYRTSLLKKIK
ncbi:DnaJ family domain-containing protein [Desulfobacter sp.]